MMFITVFGYVGYTANRQEVKNMGINDKDIRHSNIAGTWYTADPDKLREEIAHYMKRAKSHDELGKIVGLISPHAGYVYSGQVAAYAYKQVQGKKFDTVVVVAPDHSGDPRLNFSSVYTRGAYETPFGIVPVDQETAKAIVDFKASDNVEESDLGHLTGYNSGYNYIMEHSLEMQLPFLQEAIGEFKLVPIIMGDRSKESCKALAEAIAAAVKGKNALIVGSSDLSHFHDYNTAKKLDGVVSKHIETYDPDSFLIDVSMGKCEACGDAPIAVTMYVCKALGATKSTVLYMANSGDVTGDKSSVVGYLSAAFSIPSSKEEKHEKAEEKVGVELGLTEKEKAVLKDVVKETLESVVNNGNIPAFKNFNGKLGAKWGAFVTLKKHDRLRGCIGYIVGEKPLIITVAEMTKAAALNDPRFPPVKQSELPDIEFEISVLTPIREIKDINEIVVGRDGIIITKNWNRGLLLPQVATENKWNLITFLEQTCVKAGLPGNSWKDKDTTIEMFSAEIVK